MSPTHVIDNEDHLFHFDSCEEPAMPSFSSTIVLSAPHSANTLDHSRAVSSHDDPSTSEELSGREEDLCGVSGKGKGVTKPLPIRIPVAATHDLFRVCSAGSMGLSTSRDSHHAIRLPPLTSPPLKHSSFCDDAHRTHILPFRQNHGDDPTRPDSVFEAWPGKGKGKELPPSLPPLTFSPTEFGYEQVVWPSSLTSPIPGPSSYESNFGLSTTCSTTDIVERDNSYPALTPAPQIAQPQSDASNPAFLPLLERMPSRRRSLSNLSVHSTRSLAARSMSRIKLKFGSNRTPSNLARILLFRKNIEVPPKSVDELGIVNVGGVLANTSTPWHTAFKVDDLDFSVPQIPSLHTRETVPVPLDAFYYKASTLKFKGRSKSSPFPSSALDYIPVASTDIFTPIPLVIRNYFDEVLPEELRLQVLAFLVGLHQADYARMVEEGRWTVAKASSSRGRWVGRDKGVRELIRLGRVSRSWQKLVFDGQLWVILDLHAFPNIPESLLLRLTATGGPFTTSLDIAGHVQLTPTGFLDMTDNLCLSSSSPGSTLANTQLTAINLQGCPGLSSLALHYVLVRSPSLRKLCLKGLRAVTNTTCDIISTYCPQLVYLDMSRCSNLDAEGVLRLATSATDRGEHLELRELQLCGLTNMDDTTMAALGKAAPYLEVLDLSYMRRLHNSAIEAFVACEDGDDVENLGVDTILISPRDVGRESNDLGKYRRRVTRLRHLSLSCCNLLTDDVCSNLSHSVPQLEFLELAGIGAALKDEGLVRLLNTTPFIRRLDLEDAADISDSVIAAITPNLINLDLPLKPLEPLALEPGHALEQLNISYATHISDSALLSLIHGCTELKWLEADNTHIGSGVIREFVKVSRKREMVDVKLVAIDCRGISEPFVRELSVFTRPRKGWCAYEARKLMYLDARDENADDLKIGQDECDEKRVVMKSFYSWQTVDAVKSARDKRRKSTSRRAANESGGSVDLDGRVTRWWSPGGRRTPRSGRNSPLDPNSEGCTVM